MGATTPKPTMSTATVVQRTTNPGGRGRRVPVGELEFLGLKRELAPAPSGGAAPTLGPGGADAYRLEALVPLAHLELDLLALLEGSVAVHLYGGVVDEYVGALGLGYEAVALLGVEPLDCSGRHLGDPPSN